MKKKAIIITFSTLIFLTLLIASFHYSGEIVTSLNLKIISVNNSNDLFTEKSISGLVDVNTPSDKFNLISKGLDSNNWSLNENFADSNENVDITSIFSSLNFNHPNSSILISTNINASFIQDFLGSNVFNINSSLLTPFLYADIRLNDSYNTAFLFQHSGLSIYSNNDHKMYNGLTIIPEMIKDKFREKFFPEMPESEVSYVIDKEKFKVIYKNIIYFWQELPPESSIELLPGLSDSAILPLSYGIDIKYITFFDSVSFEYGIFQNEGSGITSIENKITIGELNKLIINETLPLDVIWNQSEQIDSTQIEINFDPWPSKYINLPAVSIYPKEELGKRINLPGNELLLYSSENLGDFSYLNNLDEPIELNVLIDQEKDFDYTSQGNFNNKIQYQLDTRNRQDNSIQSFNILEYDRENYNLAVVNNMLYETQMSLFNSTMRNQELMLINAKYIELYYDLLNNFSTANNFFTPSNLYSSLKTNYLLRTNLSFWDGSQLEYYHGIKLMYIEADNKNTTAIETSDYSLFGITFMSAIIILIVWRRKFR